MNQEVEANNVPMLLVSIGRWFLHVFIARIEIDSIEGIATDYTPEGINSGFANCFFDRVACRSRCSVAIEGESSVSRLTNAA